MLKIRKEGGKIRRNLKEANAIGTIKAIMQNSRKRRRKWKKRKKKHKKKM